MDTGKIEDVPFEEVHEIQRYGTYFSEKSFWKKIERVAKKVGATVLRPVFTLYYMLQDEKVPLQHKAYIIGALGYFILPFDLIPESVLPIIGFTDDVAVMTFVLKMVKDSITPEIRRKADQKKHAHQQHCQQRNFDVIQQHKQQAGDGDQAGKENLHVTIADELRAGVERFLNSQHDARRARAEPAGLGAQHVVAHGLA